MDDLRLDDLRLVAALADAPSLTAAARALGLPKQTLSRRLAEVERALGVAILIRGGHRVRLSDAGAAFAERAQQVVRQAEDAVRAVHDAQLAPTGVLRLTTTAVVAEYWLSKVVAAFLARHPQASVDLVLTERRVDLVEEGFDAAVRVGALSQSSGYATRLGPAEIGYVASPEYLAARGTPETPGDLAAHTCLVQPLGSGDVVWPFREPWGRVAVPGRLRVNSAEVIRVAAAQGQGIALLPRVVSGADVAAGRLVEVLGEFVPDVGGLWLLTQTRPVPARVRAFVDAAKQVFAR